MLKITVIGHIGQDAVIKDFNGTKYIAFSVAHSESYKDNKGNKVEKTQWISCLKYGEGAVLQYLKKGTKVYVEGDLSVKMFSTNNQPQVGVNCIVKHLELISAKQDSQTHVQQGTHSPTLAEPNPISNPLETPNSNVEGEDDLPF
jgi:single-strand DNA-binding protein